MEITYAWKITALKKAPSLNGLSDVITHIRFDYTGTDAESGKFYTFHGACPVGAPDADNFSDITALTEADVIEWAKANHPTDHMNEVIKREIGKEIVPMNEEVTELEWLQPAVVSAPVAPVAETVEEEPEA
mgnify:CR=1 FL=1|jgi:hypothetical protein